MVSLTRTKATEVETHIDPVCKMIVTPETGAATFDHNGRTYNFCAVGCKTKFAADPEKYLASQEKTRPVGSVPEHRTEKSAIRIPQSAIEYTCPMHPEIVQIGHGSCPKCGMALEPKEVSLDDTPDPEFIDMKQRFWISGVLTIPLFVLAMAEMFVDFNSLFVTLPHGQASGISMWIQLVLATPVVLWGGWPFFDRAWVSIKNVSPNMFTLIAIRTGSAHLLSLAALLNNTKLKEASICVIRVIRG